MNLKTIAKLAGVSTATVSNVINGNHHKVSESTLLRVQKVIEENNYRPSTTARSLVLRRSRIIAVVVPNLAPEEPFSVNPYNAQFLSWLECAVRRRGYYLMLHCVGRHREALPALTSWNVEGAFYLGAFQEEVQELVREVRQPAVYIDTYAAGLDMARVNVDDCKGGALAAGHLLERGHRRIAFAGPETEIPGVMQQRYRGFCEAFQRRGLPLPEQHLFPAETLFDTGRQAADRILSAGGFTAVFAGSDILAFGLLEGFRCRGVRVPEDISVVGFDDLPACRYTHPQLTSVSQNLREKAECACDCLFAMLERGERLTGEWKVDVALQERSSVRTL